MRNQISRWPVAGALLFALSACNGGGGNGLPIGGANNTGGGGVVNTNPGVGAVPANFIAPRLIDDGTVAKGKYSGFNATATDTQNAAQSPPDASTAPAFPSPPSPNGTTDAGSHAIAFSGNGLSQVIFSYGGTVPSLVYTFGEAGDSASYNYGSIVFHATYTPGMTPPGASAPAIAVEFTGGITGATYDVRVPCTLPTAGLPATFTSASATLVTCSPVPAYPTAGFLPSTPDTTGPNAVAPGSTGQFTPLAPKLYVVLTYAGISATAGSATLGIDDLYAKQ